MQQLGLVVGRPTFCNFTPRVHQKQSQKIKHHKNFPGGGMPPDPPSRRATRALIAYWNPPFENSRSATDRRSSTLHSLHCQSCFGTIETRQVTKSFLNENKRMYRWNPQKSTKPDGNDTTTLSHHPYFLCHFATTYTNMLCVCKL